MKQAKKLAKIPLIIIIIEQIFLILTFMPWLFFIPILGMAFDAPGSQNNWQNWVPIYLYILYPAWIIILSIIGWKNWSKQNFAIANITMLIAAAPATLGLIILMYSANWV